MALLVNLPFSIAGEIIGVWLNRKSLATLDSAFCNHEQRSQLNELWSSSSYIYANKVYHWSKSYVDWLLKRKLKLTKIYLFLNAEEQYIKYYLRHFGKTVRYVLCESAEYYDTLDIVISYTRNLSSFALYNSNVNMKIREVFWFNPQLRELWLYDIEGLEIVHFDDVKLEHLKLLSLANSCNSDDLLSAIIAGSPQLTHIDLLGCHGITDVGLITLAKQCPLLQCVGLCKLSASDQALSNIVKLCPQIAHLDITGNNVVTDNGILSIVQNLSNLRSFEFSDCTLLTELSLIYLTTHAHMLEIVYMCSLHQVRVSVFVSFLQKCTKLHTLNTDLFLHKYCKTIIPYMCNLTKLILWTVVTDDMLIQIAQHCTKLIALDIINDEDEDNVSDDETNEEIDILYTATNKTQVYTEKGLLAIMYGLKQLRLLGLHENMTENHWTRFVTSVWQSLRPAIQFTDTSDFFVYHVLKQ